MTACEELTGDKEEDASCKCLVKPVEGGVVDEGHDANHNANETSQQGKDHEGPGGIPVCCEPEQDRPDLINADFRSMFILCYTFSL